MATQVQTIVETPTIAPRQRSVLKFRFDPPSSPVDSSPSSVPSTKSAPAMDKCSSIVRILAKFKVVKSYKVYDPITNEPAYRLVKVQKVPSAIFDAVMDPGEAYIYKKLYIVDQHLVWKNIEKAPQNIYLVRCANDYIKLVNTKQAQQSKAAFTLFQYEYGSKNKQQQMDLRSNFHFEAKERKALQVVAQLSQCTNHHDCQNIMMHACKHPDRHPKILRGIYDFAQKLRLPSHLTWEEICFQDINE